MTITTTSKCVKIEVDLDENSLGGYDYQTTNDQQLPVKYICMICILIQKEPMLTSCCGQHFCQTCLLTSFLVSGRRCPHCKARDLQYFVNKQQQREIKCFRAGQTCFCASVYKRQCQSFYSAKPVIEIQVVHKPTDLLQ